MGKDNSLQQKKEEVTKPFWMECDPATLICHKCKKVGFDLISAGNSSVMQNAIFECCNCKRRASVSGAGCLSEVDTIKIYSN